MFQPRSASFQQDVGEDIRGVLEAALLQHSCLTQGDWLSVPHGGQQYDLRICELHPEPAVSVIDTDLEAEINPSLETEEKIREEYEAAARRAAEAALATAAAAEKAEAEAAAAEQERLQREAYRLGKEQALPAEPPLGSAEPIVTCLFRFPNGSRHSRRFPLSSPLQVSRQHAWGASPTRVLLCCKGVVHAAASLYRCSPASDTPLSMHFCCHCCSNPCSCCLTLWMPTGQAPWRLEATAW